MLASFFFFFFFWGGGVGEFRARAFTWIDRYSQKVLSSLFVLMRRATAGSAPVPLTTTFGATGT